MRQTVTLDTAGYCFKEDFFHFPLPGFRNFIQLTASTVSINFINANKADQNFESELICA